MRTKLRGKIALLLVTCAVLLAAPAVAFAADQLIADSDVVTAGDQQTRSLGTVAPGATVRPDVDFSLDCAGNNHFNADERASISFDSAGSSIKDSANVTPATASLNATSLTNISGPTNWPADGDNSCPSANAPLGSSAVTIVAPKKAGTYTYTASYTFTRGTGTDTNELAGITNAPVKFTLTVPNVAPVITAFAVPASFTAGTFVPFSYIASDANDDALTYSTTVVQGDAAVASGANDPGGVIRVGQPGTVVVQGSVSDGVNPAVTQTRTITVTSACTAPSVTTQPTNQPITYGANATFNAAASGTSPSVRWQANNGTGWSDISAATSGTLTLTKPPVSDSGKQYRAVFTNGCGSATSNAATLTVSKATADVQLKNLGPHAYDGTAKAASATTSNPSGLKADITYSQNGQAVAEPKNAGDYQVVATVNDDNYRGSANGTLKIDKASSTTTVTCTGGPFTYTGTAQTPCSVSVTGAGGLNLSPDASYSGNTNAGTATASYDYAGGTNHTGSRDSKTFAIGQKQMLIDADDQSTVYGDSNLAPSYELRGFVNGENRTTANVTGNASCLIGPAGPNVGEYNDAITCAPGDLAARNYSFAVGTKGMLTITARPITLEADAQSKTYGDADPALTFQVGGRGLAPGEAKADVFRGGLVRDAGETVAGSPYAIGKGTLSANSNYNLTSYTGASFTITARAITVEADAKSKTYGDPDPDLTYQLSSGSLVNANDLSGSLTRAAGENAGSYGIQQGALAANSNYTLTFVGANLTINRAPITIKADDASRYYDDPNPAFGYTVVSGGFKNGDLANGDVSVNLSTNATSTSKAGTYNIDVQLNGTKAGNYALTAQPGTLTILGWTNKGFFSPVDYGTTQNTVKNGSTVPLKFQVFKGTQQLTSAGIVSGLKPVVASCNTGAPIDDIEELATGGTGLRYDFTAGQFIFNWQTPKKPGTCYNVTVQMVDGTQIPVAKFWLK